MMRVSGCSTPSSPDSSSDLADSRDTPAPSPREPAACGRDGLRARPAPAADPRGLGDAPTSRSSGCPSLGSSLGAGDPRADDPPASRAVLRPIAFDPRSCRRTRTSSTCTWAARCSSGRRAASAAALWGGDRSLHRVSAIVVPGPRRVLRSRGHPPRARRPGRPPTPRGGLPRRHAARRGDRRWAPNVPRSSSSKALDGDDLQPVSSALGAQLAAAWNAARCGPAASGRRRHRCPRRASTARRGAAAESAS